MEETPIINRPEPALGVQPSDAASLSTSAVRGSMWVTMSFLVTQVVLVGNGVLLARLLSPADFSLVDISISLALLINLVGEYGLSAQIVQRKTLTKDLLSTAFWASVVVGIGLSILGIVLAPMAARYFKSPDAEPILILTSLNLLINGFGVAQRAGLVRELNFGKIARIEMAAVLGFAVISTLLALIGRGMYGYVVGWLVRTLIISATLFFSASWKPAWAFRWTLFKEMLGFGSQVMSATALRYASNNLDRFVLWKGLGSGGLGYYALARRMPSVSMNLLNAIVLKVAFPALSRVQDDRSKLKNGYLRIVRTLAMGVFPVMLLLSVLAGPFTRVVFGSQWEAAIFPMRLFFLIPCFHAINAPCAQTFQAAGRADLHLKNQMIRVNLFFLSTLVGLRWGINGVAVASMLYASVVFFITQRLVNRVIDLPLGQVVRAILPSFRNGVFTATVSGTTMVALRALGSPDWLVLLVCGSIGGAGYLLTLRLWNWRELQKLLRLLQRAIDIPRLKEPRQFDTHAP
jgi:O-antigen/teichoic acid export membrane protein